MLKSDHKADEDYLKIIVDSANNRSYPWIRVVDPWGTPLRYDYYSNDVEEPSLTFVQRGQTIRSLPLITSAGPNKQFDTSDDITNRERTEGATYQP
jgi:hypothetical protein